MTRLDTETARRIVGDVIERVERGKQLPKNKKSAEEEIDDLVDDLDEIEDEEVEDDADETDDVEDDDEDAEVEDDEDEDDDDPDDEPVKAKTKKTKKAKTEKKTSKPKAEKVGIGTVEVAAEAGVEPRQLRAYLRNAEIQPRGDREGRYNWPSLKDKEVVRIIKAVRGGAVDKMNKERIDDLKGKTAAKKSKKAKKEKASK